MDPQDYAARTDYRPPSAWYQRANRLGVLLGRLGLVPRDVVVLKVRGRRSGRPRRTPVLRTPHAGAEHLVALAGESQWVRNVRAASGEAVLRRRGARPVRLVEVPVGERAPVLAAYLARARQRSGPDAAAAQARHYFGVEPGASVDDLAAIAGHYPVFRVEDR